MAQLFIRQIHRAMLHWLTMHYNHGDVQCFRQFLTNCINRHLPLTWGTDIFGPLECARGTRFPIPSIVEINLDMAGNDVLRGKTIFGRNDLFWFAFDAFGTFYMLDNLNLRILRKYDDPYRAMSDCLIAGKVLT